MSKAVWKRREAGWYVCGDYQVIQDMPGWWCVYRPWGMDDEGPILASFPTLAECKVWIAARAAAMGVQG